MTLKDEDGDDDDDEDEEDEMEETALESYDTVIDKESSGIDEYQIFQNVLCCKFTWFVILEQACHQVTGQ